jgi:hypothetical protein
MFKLCQITIKYLDIQADAEVLRQVKGLSKTLYPRLAGS